MNIVRPPAPIGPSVPTVNTFLATLLTQSIQITAMFTELGVAVYLETVKPGSELILMISVGAELLKTLKVIMSVPLVQTSLSLLEGLETDIVA